MKIDENIQYDTVIIGAGMSGLAAGIRLAMFGQKVCILERHTISGGLNSFYARKGRRLDVGLHALTNFAVKGERGKPLTKLLKQLRIPHSDLKLHEQSFSTIDFPQHKLSFSNDLSTFDAEIKNNFPDDYQSYLELLDVINNFDEVNLENEYESARSKLKSIIKNNDLVEMLICPLLIYGSAWEEDMDFSQFVIMFKSIYLEGFSRPEGGVRTILNLLLKKYKGLGGEIYFNTGVCELTTQGQSIKSITLDDNRKLSATRILSSIGLPETLNLLKGSDANPGHLSHDHPVGQMSFCETILFFNKLPSNVGINETIRFYNSKPQYAYKKPETLCDYSSAVVCFPNNFSNGDNSFLKNDVQEGVIRVTFMANFELWSKLYNLDEKRKYTDAKDVVLAKTLELIATLYPDFNADISLSDVFTPCTIKRYTGHLNGTVYGSTDKSRDGRTEFNNLYICGTDQGFLGIVGAMLSGISMANLHCLMND